MCHALGIAGHLCPVPTFRKLIETAPSMMTKYGSSGWVSMTALTSALLAKDGYAGDMTVFDGDSGFWSFFASEKWQPEVVMDGIGKTWLFLKTIYKPYPCRGGLHAALDCFTSIIDQNNLMPEEIESVRVFGHPIEEKPVSANNEIATHIDAQFSTAYGFAVAAYRVRVGTDWQHFETMQDARIREFMKKVSFQTHPGFAEMMLKGPRTLPGLVEVVARGRTFREERMYGKGSLFADVRPTDEELANKFRQNAARILPGGKVENAIKCLSELERLDSTAELMEMVTL
jgi:2-methylcitrate dehydratase PrpD